MQEELIKEINAYFTEIYETDRSYEDMKLPSEEHGYVVQTIYFPEIVANEELPGLFDGSNCEEYDTKEEVYAKLRINLLAYVHKKIIPEAKRKVLFWRVKPEIEEWKSWEYPGRWYGYARIGIFCQ